MQDKIIANWVNLFGLTAQELSQPGTTLIDADKPDFKGYHRIWPAHQRAVIYVGAEMKAELQAILHNYPDNHVLTIENLRAAWGDAIRSAFERFYAMDPATFRPAPPTASYEVRQLSDADQAAFDAFLAACSEDDRDTGDVSIQHEAVFGTIEIATRKIVAASSMFEYYGFAELGVLTDPNYRKRGLGKAAVSGICQHLFDETRVVFYRHDEDNIGSKHIAEGLNLMKFAEVGNFRLV